MVSNSVLYNTGNILSLNELKLKAGKTSEEEVIIYLLCLNFNKNYLLFIIQSVSKIIVFL